MKFRITEITEWEEDQVMMAGDASHEGDRAVQRLLEGEREKKIDEGWQPEWLPVVVEADDVDGAIDLINERYFDLDYLKASAVEWEEAEDDDEIDDEYDEEDER